MQTIVIGGDSTNKRKLLCDGAPADVYYASAVYRATIVRHRGHDKFDVR
jgi:hypothetical protein